MNTRLIKIVVAVQAVFAAGLIAVGVAARENRRMEYLELTRRVSSGQAKSDDFLKLAAHVPDEADALTIRALFGPPLQRSAEIVVGDASPDRRSGDFWIYYPADSSGYPIDFTALAKMKGTVQCFVVDFDSKGRAQAELLWVQHPVNR